MEMIIPYTLTCKRDEKLVELSHLSLMRFADKHYVFCDVPIEGVYTIEHPPLQDWGWESTIIKLKALQKVIKLTNPKDDDWLVHIDSDVIVLDKRLFDVTGDIAGIRDDNNGHYSGCCLFIKGWVAKLLTVEYLEEQRIELKEKYPQEIDDIIISDCAFKLGAKAGKMNNKYMKHINVNGKWFAPEIIKALGLWENYTT